jgi:hypothetical protein
MLPIPEPVCSNEPVPSFSIRNVLAMPFPVRSCFGGRESLRECWETSVSNRIYARSEFHMLDIDHIKTSINTAREPDTVVPTQPPTAPKGSPSAWAV